jgi:tRNA pseudouridine55 synthase
MEFQTPHPSKLTLVRPLPQGEKCVTINGLFLLDKPISISSNQALQKVKRIFNAQKAGHTGNLDMLATGLLPICLGEATKFSQFLLEADKKYLVSACLGKRTTTLDAEGEVIEEKSTQHLTKELIEKALEQFQGEISQIPPMHSAIKIQGKRLYRLAREGVTIERKSRKIMIYSIKILSWDHNNITLEVHCSKGTYIRTLIDDLGQVLHCGAYVTALHRTATANYEASQMITLEQLASLSERDRMLQLHPLDSMLQHLPKMMVDDFQVKLLYQGKVCRGAPLCALDQINHEELVRLYDAQETFFGVATQDLEGNIKVKRLLSLGALI